MLSMVGQLLVVQPELIPDHWHKNNQSESFKG